MRNPLLSLLLFLPLMLVLVSAGQRMNLRFADGYRLRLGGLPPQIVGKGQFIASRSQMNHRPQPQHPPRWITRKKYK
ncbi:GL17714 [Drosophila persimilis]|uniref:GL17714 n=1 Tax=Drosophila persimilis TaxID=7234 RepID=B4GIH0_DROPE|nr:GL17714 [Drosophila persimilis]